jgi:hypothetical protein
MSLGATRLIAKASTGLAIALLASASAAVLVYASTIGRFVRPISDDWCQTGITRRLGIGGLINHYWHQNGRIGNAVIAAVVQTRFPGRQWLPAVLLIGGAAALYFLASTVLDILKLRAHRLVLAALSFAVAAACLIRDGSSLEGNLQYQNLFWAPGSITHTLPPLAMATLGAVALRLRRSRWFLAALPVAYLAATLLGTLTEIFTVLLAALLIMTLAARRFHGCHADRVDVVLATGVAAMATGTAIVALSPGLRTRTDRSPLSAAILRAALHAEPTLLHRSLLEPWLLVPLACGLLFGGFVHRSGDRPAHGSAAVWWSSAACLLCAFGGSILTSVAVASAYKTRGRGAVGFPRTWGDFMVSTGLTAFVAATCLSYVAVKALAAKRSGDVATGQTTSRQAWRAVSAVLVAAVSCGVLFVSATNLHSVAPAYRLRATQWDAQNTRITGEINAGTSRIRYSGLPLAGLADPFTPAGKRTFATECLAQYYNVSEVDPLRPRSQPHVH